MVPRNMPIELRRPAYHLERTQGVAPTASVRHFDQLSERAQEALVSALDGCDPGVPATEFEPGEVVVHTEYVRVRDR